MSVPYILAWFGVEPGHLLLIALVALLLFGKRLPEVGRSLGKGIAEFKKGLHDVQDELNKNQSEPEPPRKQLRRPDDNVDARPEQIASPTQESAGQRPADRE